MDESLRLPRVGERMLDEEQFRAELRLMGSASDTLSPAKLDVKQERDALRQKLARVFGEGDVRIKLVEVP